MNVKKSLVAAIGSVLFVGLVAVPQVQAQVDAKAVFETLKGLAGTWRGEGGAEGQKFPWIHEIRVSSNGTVVMETMGPGTEYEMINMYHLDGQELVLTHYCASGNQPTMKLDRAHATASTLPFLFTGGTNLDPAKDQHIHESKMVLLDANTFETNWTGWTEGKQADTISVVLKRQVGE